VIFSAAAHAQRAVDYLHGLQPEAAIEAGGASAEERAA
jgi:antirestriction protein ArdC